ncbi:type II toxin-antitoxin system RelE family toxin [Deinococcus sp. PEB2-63]
MTPKKKATQTDSIPPRAADQAEAMNEFQVSLTEDADADLAEISDAKTRAAILRRALALQHDPLAQGKALTGNLKNYRSLRAAGQRYRILYQVAMQAGQVVVVVIGIRQEGSKRDAYAVADKRLS